MSTPKRMHTIGAIDDPCRQGSRHRLDRYVHPVLARGGDEQPRVYVHLDHGRSLERWAARHARGEVWESSPYSYADAADQVALQFSVDRRDGRVGRFLRKGSTRILGFDLFHALGNRAGLRWADVVWTHTEREHLAVLTVVRTLQRGSRPHVVAQTIWLWDGWATLSPPRRWLYRRLLGGAAVHTTLSPVNEALAKRALPAATVTHVPYGTLRLPLLPPVMTGDRPSVRVVAPGNDRHRDWPTLLDVARADPTIEVRILARPKVVGDVTDLPNVTVTQCTDRASILAAYEWADAVVVPLQPNGHASGITVGLEALNVGRPLVITGVGGVEQYFADTAWYPPPGDARALGAAIHAAATAAHEPGMAERGRQTVAVRGLTAEDWVARHVLITEHVLGRRSSLDVVAAFRPVATAR